MLIDSNDILAGSPEQKISSNKADVSIIIVTSKRLVLLTHCLESKLSTDSEPEVIIDNGSSDGGVRHLG